MIKIFVVVCKIKMIRGVAVAQNACPAEIDTLAPLTYREDESSVQITALQAVRAIIWI